MIEIRWDFSKGDEISYGEGLEKEVGFATHCLEFFSQHFWDQVRVVKEDGSYIDLRELLAGDDFYTSKEIRPAHNLRKMLVSGAFNFKEKL